ncbi:META domain-containing protein [Jannaschia formosa]|uniref:META domain-containing protein n=1 Tax=Jannaschia formosa TaxID=2259592 RepID=UPI000E1C1D8A|nr:META domain-containing protein [Jannaschia formosa]TFL17471.1 META domain-containing protein [Jannaschia formosa]
MLRIALLLPLLLMACKDETVSGWSDPSTTWLLQEIDGTPFTARATLTFPEEGAVRGEGPCNLYTAQQTQPYPWLGMDRFVATRRACPDLPAESAFFSALLSMTLVEASDSVLILGNDAGGEMVFRAAP